MLETILQDGVEVSHQYQGEGHSFVADAGQLSEQFAQAHAAPQGMGGRFLDDGPVGHRVTERDADFYHVDAFLLQGLDDVDGVVGVRISGTKINGEDMLLLSVE